MEIESDGRRGIPKMREILRRPRGESDTTGDFPHLDFIYEDSDKYISEIAELYSYTEEPEFRENLRAYETIVLPAVNNQKWSECSVEIQKNQILKLLNMSEITNREKRMASVRALLYIVQGVFNECDSEDTQTEQSRKNIFLLYECGAFNILVELLNMETDNGVALNAAMRKPAVSIADSADLRCIINIMYTMVEVIRREEENDSEKWKYLRETFRQELNLPVYGDESLAVLLFGMVTKFCGGSAPHFPMKKVLLLLWKVILFTLGGLQGYHNLKNDARQKAELPILTEDPLEICRNMRASSPPASAADFIEQQQQPVRTRSRAAKKSLMKQNGLDETFAKNGVETGDETDVGLQAYPGGNNAQYFAEDGSDDEGLPNTPPRPDTPTIVPKGLPWKPKVRLKDLESFFDQTRSKFVGFQVKNDHVSLAGLPLPIHEGVRVLKQHMYVSLTELQTKREEELAKNPLTKKETEIEETPYEILYRNLLPNLPQDMIALLKILLAAAPTSKAKTDSINILADVLPDEMPTTVLQSMKLGIDVNRHKEIIVKSISALLLLLLKYFKLNHVYQFEFMSQHLVFANCIPLVLKFFNQNINSYVTARNTINIIDFPCCVIGEQPDLTAECLEAGDCQPYCWRNLFSCINLLRILNKLTKWKHSRTMMLVVFKSAPILKRALKVKQAMMQLYVLKLLKLQTKYLGRQWRKSNMKTLSAIYQKVRHRLNDDWAYGNDMDARPWDFQAEECALRSCVDRFNNRRYGSQTDDPDFEPVDNCILSVLGQEVELSDDFKENYERWLHLEVYTANTAWEQVLVTSS